MARYKSGEEAMEGDEVEAIETYGAFFKEGDRFQDVKFSAFGHITAEGMGGGFHAGRFKLIRRAPTPEPEQPAVKNGTYACGSGPMEGDLVECVNEDAPYVHIGTRYCVVRVDQGDVLVSGIDFIFFTSRFKLISRKQEQPMSEPLVKWPEEAKQLTWLDLEPETWFVFDVEPRESQCICYRVHSGWVPWMYPSGSPQVTMVVGVTQERIPVRRLKMTQPPKFIVI
jgi:hypothetical protein